MARLFRAFAALAVLFAAACSDQPTAEDAGSDLPRDLLEPTLSIVDGVTGAGGNPGFRWLRPIGESFFLPGRGDGDLYPRIEICPRNAAGDGCDNAPLLVEFNRDDPDRKRRINVDWQNDYNAVWRMNDARPERGGIYRIRVLIGDQELGHADIIAIRRPLLAAYLRRNGADPLPVSDRGLFVISFRIEEGALEDQFCDFDGDGDVQDCDAGVERPGDGQATTVQVTAQNQGGGQAVAAVITAPDGVFTDVNGNPIPDVVLTAEVELAPPSDDVFPDNQELPFFVEVNTFPDNVYIDPNGPGVSVVICQDSDALTTQGVPEALHPQLILYKVGDNGVTRRLQSTYGAPECDDFSGGGVGGMAGLLQKGGKGLLGLVTPQPLRARRLHGGLNTVIRRDVSLSQPAFSTFGAALGPNAAQTTAAVPSSVTEGDDVPITVQARNALGEAFLFGGDVLDVTVTGANDGAPVTVVDNGDGTYAVSYTATNPGTDQVAIVLDRMDYIVPSSISGSPFTVVVDPIAPAGGTVEATVFEGESPLSGATVELFIDEGTSLQGVSDANGMVIFTNVPPTQGTATYGVEASLVGYDFDLQPVSVQAGATTTVSLFLTADPVPGVADATTSVATVPGGATGYPTYMWVELLDAFQSPLTAGGDDVQATVSGANSGAVAVTDNGDGTYLLEYTPLNAGVDAVDVTVNGASFSVGPYPSTVYAPVEWSTGSGGNGHFYLYRPILRRAPFNLWTTSEAEADAASFQALPGHLLVVDDANEQAFLSPLLGALGGSTAWIGFDDANADGTYEWATGEVLATGVTSAQVVGTCVASFCNFALNEPNRNGGIEFYGEILGSGFGSLWNDIPNDPGQRVVASIIEFEPASGSLDVTVTNGGTPVPGATVQLTGTSVQAALTNASGVASFRAIPTGAYSVTANLAGFNFGTVPATVNTFELSVASVTGAPAPVPPVITNILPSTAAAGTGQFITIIGQNFNVLPTTVTFTQGATSLNGFIYAGGSPTQLVVRLPSGLAADGPGVPTAVTVTSDGVSNAYNLPVSTTPGTPVVIEVLEAAWTGTCTTGTPTDGSLLFGSAVIVRAHGFDTLGPQLRIVQGGNTWTLNSPCASGAPVAHVYQVPVAGAAGDGGLGTLSAGAAQIQVRTSVGGVPSAWSAPIDVTLGS